MERLLKKFVSKGELALIILNKKTILIITSILIFLLIFLWVKHPDERVYWKKFYKYDYPTETVGVYSTDMQYACDDCVLYKVLAVNKSTTKGCSYNKENNQYSSFKIRSAEGNIDIDGEDDSVKYNNKIIHNDFYIGFNTSEISKKFNDEVRSVVGVNTVAYAFYFCGYPKKNYFKKMTR